MKLKLLTFFILSSLIIVPSVSSQTATPLSRKQIVTEKVASRQAEIRSKISAVRRERIRNYFGKMVVRIEATIERLQILIDRIETRIAKIKEGDEEINTTEVEITVTDAKETLEKAKTELDNLKTNLEDMLASDNPRDNFQDVRNSLKTVIGYIREAHKSLAIAIGNIKGLRVGGFK